jgi:hypothetical protein
MNSADKQKLMTEELRTQNNGKTLDLMIPEYLQNKCVGYSDMFGDLSTCQEALKELKNVNQESIIGRSLFTTVIILYGKCFTDSSSSNSPKLEKDVFKNDSSFLKLHDEIMELRHHFIAHRGKTDNAFGRAFLQINPIKMQGNIKVGHYNTTNFSPQRIPEYFKLINFLKIEVRKKFSSNEKKVIKYIFQNLTNQEFKDLVINK